MQAALWNEVSLFGTQIFTFWAQQRIIVLERRDSRFGKNKSRTGTNELSRPEEEWENIFAFNFFSFHVA